MEVSISKLKSSREYILYHMNQEFGSELDSCIE